MSSAPLLDIQNATVWRGHHRIFSNLSLTIPSGQSTVILGPNGAGKSTLIKLLSREIYPEYHPNSYVKIFGDAQSRLWELRSRLGFISADQQIDLDPNLLALDAVVCGLCGGADARLLTQFSFEQVADCLALMETLQIAHLRHRTYGSLSTGEQRRIILARALVHHPEALILDEPLNGMDLKSALQFLSLIRSLIRSGRTIILVTHQLSEIVPEISHAALLKDGQVIAHREKASLINSEYLSDLYDYQLNISWSQGYCNALPADF